jgi:hypothetical protein
VIDVAKMQRWLSELELDSALDGEATLRVQLRPDESSPRMLLPPFFIQCGEHWVLLSMLPMIAAGEPRPQDMNRRLLAANRDMRVAKFAIDESGDVILCAELPTESLDFSELADAVKRMIQYARLFAFELVRR